jgi:large subunit ribosomal protein L35
MAYKFKPNKSVAKRFKVSKTGKIKHRHEMNSHLRSGRTGSLKRRLGRASVLSETQAKNMRRYMGLSKLKPAKVIHERALAATDTDASE